MELHEVIKGLPKAEQHIHLIGSMRPETLLWLVDESGSDSPFQSVEDVRSFFRYRGFPHFLEVYATCMTHVSEERFLERIAYEMLEDESRSNVRYVEVLFSAIQRVRRAGLDFGSMIDHVNRGIRRARRDLGIECTIRVSTPRDYGPEWGMKTLDLIEEKGDNILAIDIGGSEHLYPPRPFAPVYERAGEMGLRLVAHAGEALGPESIWDAVRHLKVERIGHGVSARDDPDLIVFLKERGVTVEACPTSNLRTGVIERIEDHPIRTFFDQGVSVTVNSDDPTMFGTDMNREYLNLSQKLGFTVPELFQLSVNAVKTSFLPPYDKERLLDEFDRVYQRQLPHLS